MKKDFLPVGTVVSLKNSKVKVMIMGYYPSGNAKPGYVWDYSGVLYPMGYTDGSQILQFDAEQIGEVMAMGYQDVEQFSFIERLQEAAEKVKTQEKEEEAPDTDGKTD